VDVVNPELTFDLSATYLDTGKPGLRDIVNPNKVSWKLYTSPAVSSLVLSSQPSDTLAGVPMQARVNVTLFSGRFVVSRSTRIVHAEIISTENVSPNVTAVLMGKTSVRAVDGSAIFTDLTLPSAGSFRLRFYTKFADQRKAVLPFVCVPFVYSGPLKAASMLATASEDLHLHAFSMPHVLRIQASSFIYNDHVLFVVSICEAKPTCP